jgi:hypothetical protein
LRYSRLFSKINWKPTIPYFVTTRRHPIIDIGDSFDSDITTMIIPEVETTEQTQVLPFPTTIFSLEKVSNI